MSLLEITDLKVHFPVRTGRFGGRKDVVKAVDGVSLIINANETLAVVGESGCGKTTIGNAVLGLAPVTAGRITFEGRDLSTLTPAFRATHGAKCRWCFKIRFRRSILVAQSRNP